MCNTSANFVFTASRTHSFQLRNNKIRTDPWLIALGKEEDNSNSLLRLHDQPHTQISAKKNMIWTDLWLTQ